MDRTIVLLFLINLYCACASPYNVNQLMKRDEKFCGPRLRSMLSLICNGNYYTPMKKSLSDILNYNEYEEAAENGLDENELIFPFLQKDSVKSLIPRKFRKTTGIVNECCYRSCTREHLQLYCAK